MKSLAIVGFLFFLMSTFGFSDKHRNNSERRHSNDASISINRKISQVVLRTSNGCGIGNFLIPSTGDSSQGALPVLGSILSNGFNYTYNIIDTIPGTQIMGIAFKREGWAPNTSLLSAYTTSEPYVIISDVGMFSYQFSSDFSIHQGNIYNMDSLFIPGILKMAKQITTDANSPIVLLVQDTMSTYRIRVYSYPGLLEQFNFAFHFEPDIFEVTDTGLFITGRDTTGTNMLYHFSTLQDTLYATYPLNDYATNSQEFLTTGNSHFLLSSPGDSITILTTLDITDSTLSQTVVYPHSGARATYNEYRNNKNFTFQPTDSVLGKQILVLDPVTGQFIDTVMINLKLDWFKHPEPVSGGFGAFSMGWIGARWENGTNDSVFISSDYGNYIVNLESGAFPKDINATFGCWVGVPENEVNEIKFDVYPNPASSQAVINLTGLKKGRQYKLTIINMAGEVNYETTLEAYQEIQLPIDSLLEGLYLLKLDTGKNIISKKLVIK